MSLATLETKDTPIVIYPADSQLMHQSDPDLLLAPADAVRERIKALHIAGEFEAAEACLTAMAVRTRHDAQTPHFSGDEVTTATRPNPERYAGASWLSLLLDRVFRY